MNSNRNSLNGGTDYFLAFFGAAFLSLLLLIVVWWFNSYGLFGELSVLMILGGIVFGCFAVYYFGKWINLALFPEKKEMYKYIIVFTFGAILLIIVAYIRIKRIW